MGYFFVVGFLTNALKSYIGWYATNFVINDFASRLYGRVIRLGIRWHQDAKPGEVLRRFDRAWNGLWVMQHSAVQSMIPSTLSFILVLIVGFYLHWQLTLIALLPVPFALVTALVEMEKVMEATKKY